MSIDLVTITTDGILIGMVEEKRSGITRAARSVDTGMTRDIEDRRAASPYGVVTD
jgi:hypothetical protein